MPGYLITVIDRYERIFTLKLDDESENPEAVIANCLDVSDFDVTLDKGIRIEHMEGDEFVTLYKTGCFH